MDFGNNEKRRYKHLLLLKSQHAVEMKAGQNKLGRVTWQEQNLRLLLILEQITRTCKLRLVRFLNCGI